MSLLCGFVVVGDRVYLTIYRPSNYIIIIIEKEDRADIKGKDVIPAIFKRFRDIVFNSVLRGCVTDISDMGPGNFMTN